MDSFCNWCHTEKKKGKDSFVFTIMNPSKPHEKDNTGFDETCVPRDLTVYFDLLLLSDRDYPSRDSLTYLSCGFDLIILTETGKGCLPSDLGNSYPLETLVEKVSDVFTIVVWKHVR